MPQFRNALVSFVDADCILECKKLIGESIEVGAIVQCKWLDGKIYSGEIIALSNSRGDLQQIQKDREEQEEQEEELQADNNTDEPVQNGPLQSTPHDQQPPNKRARTVAPKGWLHG